MVNLLFYHKQMQSFWPFKRVIFQNMVDSLLNDIEFGENWNLTPRMNFLMQGFFWPVEWTERRFLASIRIKVISMPRYEIIKQLGLLTRRASHNFLSHHRVGSEVQLLAYPIFNGDVWEKQKVRGSDLSSYPIRDLKDRFELKTSLPGAKAGHRRNQLGW